MKKQEQLTAREKQEKIRTILMDNNVLEYGDTIIDEICQVVGIPDTCDIADEHGNLHPQSYFKKQPTLAEQMIQITKTVEDRDKLDIIFNNLVLPKIKEAAERKQREVEFSTFSSSREDTEVKKVFPKETSLQGLVSSKMKPYLEEKGFFVALCQPAYFTYIRW